MKQYYAPITGSLISHLTQGAFAESEFANTGYARAYAQFRTGDRSINASNVTAVSMDNVVMEAGEMTSCRVNFVLAKFAPDDDTVQIGPTVLFSVGIQTSFDGTNLVANFSESTADFIYSPINGSLVYNTSDLTEFNVGSGWSGISITMAFCQTGIRKLFRA